MNLLKNVNGTWEKARQLVRQDLDTIQRTVNQILGQINAPAAAAAIPPATITPANSVTTYGAVPLTSVATAPDGGLSGNGTPTNPLIAQQIRHATGLFTTAQVIAMLASPVTMIAGVAGKIIVPLACKVEVVQVNGVFGTTMSPFLRYAGDTVNLFGLGTIGANTQPHYYFNVGLPSVLRARDSITGTFEGLDLVANSTYNSSWTPGGSPVYTCDWVVDYILL